ncbi:hypothetical protein HID58_057601 [Brassica napus]|uniref:Uncharacterized protein n=4 Tax=Brassica TaxID=3705 RepID=A0ABQ8ARM4_BRANA|nr:hypothetical protein HID58_057601 [Brassica napus]
MFIRGCKSHTIPYSHPIFFSSSNSTQHKLLFSSQTITGHNNNPHGHDELPMKQEEPHHHFHNIPPWLISSNPNPNGNNANYFPLASSSASFLHSSPAMSATALLQKVAQMGPTKSTATPEEEELPHHHHGVGEAFDGGFIAVDKKNDVGDDGGGETRDFLGLRSLMSHNEMLGFANNLGNCINTSASEQQERYSHQD